MSDVSPNGFINWWSRLAKRRTFSCIDNNQRLQSLLYWGPERLIRVGHAEFFLIRDLKEKKLESEVLTTPAQIKLEPKITWSKILSLSAWAFCELTNASGKRSIKPFRSQRTAVQAPQLRALAMHEQRSFRFAFFKYQYNIYLALVKIRWFLPVIWCTLLTDFWYVSMNNHSFMWILYSHLFRRSTQHWTCISLLLSATNESHMQVMNFPDMFPALSRFWFWR